jgi:hypothetical protein
MIQMRVIKSLAFHAQPEAGPGDKVYIYRVELNE